MMTAMSIVPLSDRCQAIILGSLLGDGSLAIQKSYRHARFSFRHALSQKEYFFWKVRALSEIASDHCVWEQKDKGFGIGKLRFQSLALEPLTALYHLTHHDTRRGTQITIRRTWLNLLTPLSLAVWWMDDGSLVSDSRQGVFCTDGFPYKDVLLCKQYLLKVWDIHVGIGKVQRRPEREQYRLWIRSTEELKKFLRIILPHIPIPEMLPKVLLLYNDPQLQERWISEVCQLTTFSRDTVERYLAQKKAKWQQFRK